jgi:hypothetical protein
MRNSNQESNKRRKDLVWMTMSEMMSAMRDLASILFVVTVAAAAERDET